MSANKLSPLPTLSLVQGANLTPEGISLPTLSSGGSKLPPLPTLSPGGASLPILGPGQSATLTPSGMSLPTLSPGGASLPILGPGQSATLTPSGMSLPTLSPGGASLNKLSPLPTLSPGQSVTLTPSSGFKLPVLVPNQSQTLPSVINNPATKPSLIPPTTNLIIEKSARYISLKDTEGKYKGYAPYFEALGGKLDPNLGVWLFSKRKEAQLREIVDNILTGKLPLPENQPPATPFEVGAITSELPITETVVPSKILTEEQPVLEIPATKRGKKKEPPPSTPGLPSQAVQMIGTSPLPVIGQISQTPNYSPLDKEPGEATRRYTRRVQIYRALLAAGVEDHKADMISRMKNNVDFDSGSYNKEMMNLLDQYLPNQPKN